MEDKLQNFFIQIYVFFYKLKGKWFYLYSNNYLELKRSARYYLYNEIYIELTNKDFDSVKTITKHIFYSLGIPKYFQDYFKLNEICELQKFSINFY